MGDIEHILGNKGFHIKEWVHNIDETESDSFTRSIELQKEDSTETEGVLGLQWNPAIDKFSFRFKR